MSDRRSWKRPPTWTATSASISFSFLRQAKSLTDPLPRSLRTDKRSLDRCSSSSRPTLSMTPSSSSTETSVSLSEDVGAIRRAVSDRVSTQRADGNGASAFTQSGATARYFEKHIEAGQVGLNVPIPCVRHSFLSLFCLSLLTFQCARYSVPLPMFSWSGGKGSVLGGSSLYGPRGLDFFTQLKVSRGENGFVIGSKRGPVSSADRSIDSCASLDYDGVLACRGRPGHARDDGHANSPLKTQPFLVHCISLHCFCRGTSRSIPQCSR